MFCFGGYHYGYNALKENFMSVGVFSYLRNGTDSSKQEMMFNYAFNTWINTQMVLISGAGLIMDKVGLRVLKLLAVSLYCIGTVMFAFTNEIASALLFPAGILVALGSVSSLICDHQISSMFPAAQGLAIALISGAFDSSAMITFIITKISPDISLGSSFVFLAVASLVYGLLMGCFVLTRWAPDMAKQSRIEEIIHGMELGPEKQIHNASAIEQVEVDKILQNIVRKRYPTLQSCILSLPFAALSLSFTIALLRLTYFFTQLVPILNRAFPDQPETVTSLLKISSILLTAGLVVSPFSGFVLVYSKLYFKRRIEQAISQTSSTTGEIDLYWMYIRSMAPGFLVLAVSGILCSALQFSTSQIAFYTSCIVLAVYRSVLFSVCTNFILIAFPLRNFGTVNGLLYTLGGILNLLENIMQHVDTVSGVSISLANSCMLLITPIFLFLKRN
ncbi:unnamed protein product [Echinostoma caproni]|uniref:MFS domain-containing protein n=1 Tax=Echinostoma caproni TaxID=27848 RepID=A0A182ZZA6_9TREM|nr:unnamed protein product [Echinostoma caproni]